MATEPVAIVENEVKRPSKRIAVRRARPLDVKAMFDLQCDVYPFELIESFKLFHEIVALNQS